MSEKAESKIKKAAGTSADWFVRTGNGSVFGPINVKGLVYWACDGRILPEDEVSRDREIWRPACELAELKMNMMIERPDGTFMGPFNAQAIQPLIQEGKIPPHSKPFPAEEFEARQVSEKAQRKLADAVARSEELQAEYNELLSFSNARDIETREKLRVLEAEQAQLKDSIETRGLVPARRLEDLEARMAEAFAERDLLREQLAEAVAMRAIATHPVEGDIALVKMFAEGALEMMRKTLEQEKARNTAARAASAEMQGMIHAEIERLERVRARDPGEISRSEQMGQRAEHQIAKLQQEIESVRRHHQADMARAEANEKAMGGQCKALIQKEALLREKLSRIEQRTAEYDSLTSQLRRKESTLLGAEKEFEEERQQWQIIESTLQHRIEELERGAGLLFDSNDQSRSADSEESIADTDSRNFRVQPWMRKMKRN